METIVKKILPSLPSLAPVTDKATKPEAPPTGWRSPERRRQLWIAVIVAVILVLAFVLWRAFFSPVTVALAPVQSNVQEQVFGLGVVGARVESNVGFKVAGVLVGLDADQGDRVHAGQVLARLDARDVAAQVAVAKANVAQAQAAIVKANADIASTTANLTNAARISARDARLVKSGVVSTEAAQTDEAAVRVGTANVAVARSELTQAEAALQSAEAQQAFEEATLANYMLTAPYDGWVISRNLELGSGVNPGQSVFTLVEANTVWAVGYVDERLAGRLHVGQPAEIALRSDSGKRFSGHVARIEIQSDAVNEERLVDVTFDQIPARIHLAEQAEVYITTGTVARAVVVPQTAVANLADGKGVVWTLENGRLAKHAVTFGPELLNGGLPVLAGVPDGASVVLPQSNLRVGERARAATSAP
ncbi:MAG: efflux RND transporter periplasmic adaptor subunit [Alphaproteobacteria bacterium]|nr:efflux RND transporter periplasmic adaptor subunit [Alphaproteobacteria bacterium]